MAVIQLFRFSVLLVLSQLLCRGATQQCRAGGSEQSVFGWMLKGHVYKTMMAEIGHVCLFTCRQDDRCQSFNFVISRHMCEFSNRTKEARPEDFIPNPDRFYFRRDIKRVPLGSIPELPGESCKEIKESEKGQAVSGKYWFDTIKPGVSVLAKCDMESEDVDECSASCPVCHDNATCQNTLGSYICSCKEGFTGDGRACEDVDECSATDTHNCSRDGGECHNTKGSYKCQCRPGYTGDGQKCTDVDECTAAIHDCHPTLANCINTAGSYNCSCNSGYIGNGKTTCEPEECQNYTSLSSGDRKETYGPDDNGQCDRNLGPGWFRFEGAAGSRMATTCPPMYRCGTLATGWLNGGHPSVADGQVTRQVCFHWTNNCCHWTTNIKVRNCGSFYVYYLSGTPGSICNLRYCGSD